MTAKLVYIAIASLDGYIEDEGGKFDWAKPDAEVHGFVNDLMRPLGTFLYGRRLYETMKGWEDQYRGPEGPPVARDFAELWRAADKIVYSKTLSDVATRRTRLERSFDPGRVLEMKGQAKKDLGIGGPELAASAFRAGLVDECHLLLAPVIVGGGKRSLPNGLRARLDLSGERRFRSGAVHLAYRVHVDGPAPRG